MNLGIGLALVEHEFVVLPIVHAQMEPWPIQHERVWIDSKKSQDHHCGVYGVFVAWTRFLMRQMSRTELASIILNQLHLSHYLKTRHLVCHLVNHTHF